MTSALFIGAALTLAAVVLVGCVAIGLFGYQPERAQKIRDSEATEPVMVEEVRRIHVGAPDRFRRGRIDRHPFYLLAHITALGYSVCILAGAPITSNLSVLTSGAKFTMACCFLVGSTLVLFGATMGAHIWRWDIMSGVADHIAAARLGDDIRLPYTFGAIGMFAMGISGAIYSATSFGSTLGSLGGWMTGGIFGIGCALMLVVYCRRIRQFSRTLKVVVDQAVANVIRRGGHDLE